MAHAYEITILIPDPDEMMFVTGMNDQNIDRIEREFGVKVISRGAELRISGDPASVARVSDLVTAMRGISGRDEELRKPALERLIGDAKERPVVAPEELREHIATTTTGKRIKPQSENQRRYVEAIKSNDLVFAIGVAGTGKCIASDSLVLTGEGIAEIGSLGAALADDAYEPSDVVIHGLEGAENASHVYSGGVSDTIKILTRFGYAIEATPEHPLLVMDPSGDLQWRRSDALKRGDVVALQRGQRMFGTCTRVGFDYAPIQPWGDHSKPVVLEELDEQMAYFMGIVTGDGCVTERNRIALTSADADVIEAFHAVARRFDLNVFVNRKGASLPDHVIASSQLYRLLAHLGVGTVRAPQKRIPCSVLRAPERIVRAFLRGLYDTDGSLERGSVVSLTLTSERLIREVQIVLLNLGIVSSRGLKHGRYNGQVHVSHRLVIAGAEVDRFFDLVGFTLRRKCSLVTPQKRNVNVDVIPFVAMPLHEAMRETTLTRAQHARFADYRRGSRRPSYEKLGELVATLEEKDVDVGVLAPLHHLLDLRLLFVEVVSLEPSRSKVFDLTVPGTHSFVANGFVNHNSYLAVAMGVQALRERRVNRLILTRPAVEAGERLGFLPGDLREKVDPYLRPLYDALYDLMPPERSARAMERGEIEVAPLAYMRGRTLNEAFIILDEAQNTTPAQMKMFLTRLGYGSQAVVTGDVTQIDLAPGQPSGLLVARGVLESVEGISFVDFDERDVIRHELVARIVHAYERYDKESGGK
ncbi:MAG: PhoH family protein [Chloroflexota bacterium]|nr:PhoH family protein [Chloroflexota bacterium]MDE3192877.1 PhoH family protein [Chloroflexota bacterium]